MILIKNGHVVDPQNNLNDKFDILIEKGEIKRIEKSIQPFVIAADGRTLHNPTSSPFSIMYLTIGTSSIAGIVFGMHTTVVYPPATAALLPDSISSL